MLVLTGTHLQHCGVVVKRRHGVLQRRQHAAFDVDHPRVVSVAGAQRLHAAVLEAKAQPSRLESARQRAARRRRFAATQVTWVVLFQTRVPQLQ